MNFLTRINQLRQRYFLPVIEPQIATAARVLLNKNADVIYDAEDPPIQTSLQGVVSNGIVEVGADESIEIYDSYTIAGSLTIYGTILFVLSQLAPIQTFLQGLLSDAVVEVASDEQVAIYGAYHIEGQLIVYGEVTFAPYQF